MSTKKIALEDIARVLNGIQAVTGSGHMKDEEKEYIRWRIFNGVSKFASAKKTGMSESRASEVEAQFLSAVSREVNT